MATYVREAEQGDIMSILRLLRMFCRSTEVGRKYFSPRAVTGMISYSQINGCCLVAIDKDENRVIGVIMGSINVNPWTDTTRELREIAWFMDPTFKGERGGGMKLYKRYVEISREMIENGSIVASHMATLANSGKRIEDIVSMDFQAVETNYMMTGGFHDNSNTNSRTR